MRFVSAQLLAGVFLVVALLAPPAWGQSETRAAKIQAERLKKKRNAEPETLSKAEARLNEIKDRKLIERLTNGADGLTVVLGGLPTGQGFALGPQYSRRDLAGGALMLRTSLRASTARGYLAGFELNAPHLAGDRIFAKFLTTHLNAPRIDYFGPGPDSLKEDRTHFLLETTSVGGEAGVNLARGLRVGTHLGLLLVNTGPGNIESRRPRTEDVFTAMQVPGLVNQSDFRVGGFFAQYDYRDNPLGPRSGGNYIARFSYFDDMDLGLHEFRRLHLEAQQYIPLFNQRRVIALRAATQMSFENGPSSTVPFYLQPVLGGSDDLRGFRQYRFYDNNSIIANIEYRWESFTGLDMALFFDAGKVAPKTSQINFHDVEASVGIGLRFNVRNSTFIRLDTGFSHEGIRFWFKFGNPF